jgi:hypothetical protein
MIFSSLQDGLHYFTDCPLCRESMKIENIGFKQILYGRGNQLGYTLLFSLDYDDKLIVNPVTEEIIIDLVRQENNTDPQNYTSYKLNTNSYISYNGIMFHGVPISCSRCGCFTYTIKLTIDLNNRRLMETSLSNIKLALKEGSRLHEITNYFGKEQTIYCLIDETRTLSKPVTLPFIEMNLESPSETLDRIKKLLVFS